MAVEQWLAGFRMTADRMNAITPRWSAWTPTWTTATGANTPAFGNATIDCKYAQSGDVVFFEMEITMGSTTTYGGGGSSDDWRFSLPVTAAETQLIAGMGEIQDGAATGRWPVRARLATTSTVSIELSGRNYNDTANVNSGLVDAVTPFTWANTDRILMTGHYQSA
jgi:hypothetical protein